MNPIKPSEVKPEKDNRTPNEVIEVFNELIVKNWSVNSAMVFQKDAAELIAETMKVSTGYLYKNSFLDIEDIYRKAGWVVKYDKPAYNETYEAYFVFSKK